MTELTFSKMQGLGNDFMVLESLTQCVDLKPALIRQWADRRKGVGFDQLLLIEPPSQPDFDFRYRIFNADGSEAGQCGNGARCVGRFLVEKGFCPPGGIRLQMQDSAIALNVRHMDKITVDMGDPVFTPERVPFLVQAEQKSYQLEVNGVLVEAGVVSMGNPHAVIKVTDIHEAPVATLGAELECHALFPERVNVGFMQVLSPDHIKLRVFERGVGETPACGTGACAAVAVGFINDWLGTQVRVELPGGVLQIAWSGPSHPIRMTGPAVSVYEGKLHFR